LVAFVATDRVAAMIEQILSHTASLENNWSRANFPKLALESLNTLELPQSLKEIEQSVAKWLLDSKEIPPQVNLLNNFGEPAVTIFNNGKFAVDIYFWRKNDTVIHSHAFRGAFKVIHGQSLHEEFQVSFLDAIDQDISFSTLSESTKTIMKTGSTQIINPGTELVHSVLHLDNPTITLCIRTVEDVELDQWSHLRTGMSYKIHNLQKETIKRVLYFEFMHAFHSDEALVFLNKSLVKMKTSEQISLFEAISMNTLGLDYDVACLVQEQMNMLFKQQVWFKNLEEHFEIMEYELDSHQASSAGTKMLAHAVNNQFSLEETQKLLSQISAADIKNVAKQLLTESAVLNEEYSEIQIEKIKAFI
jgi:hypothetical protein